VNAKDSITNDVPLCACASHPTSPLTWFHDMTSIIYQSVYEYKDTALTLLKQLDFKIPLVVPKKATVT